MNCRTHSSSSLRTIIGRERINAKRNATMNNKQTPGGEIDTTDNNEDGSSVSSDSSSLSSTTEDDDSSVSISGYSSSLFEPKTTPRRHTISTATAAIARTAPPPTPPTNARSPITITTENIMTAAAAANKNRRTRLVRSKSVQFTTSKTSLSMASVSAFNNSTGRINHSNNNEAFDLLRGRSDHGPSSGRNTPVSRESRRRRSAGTATATSTNTNTNDVVDPIISTTKRTATRTKRRLSNASTSANRSRTGVRRTKSSDGDLFVSRTSTHTSSSRSRRYSTPITNNATTGSKSLYANTTGGKSSSPILHRRFRHDFPNEAIIPSDEILVMMYDHSGASSGNNTGSRDNDNGINDAGKFTTTSKHSTTTANDSKSNNNLSLIHI